MQSTERLGGRTSKGENAPDPGRVARAGVEGSVRGRAAGNAGPDSEGAEARKSGKPDSPERFSQVYPSAMVRQHLIQSLGVAK